MAYHGGIMESADNAGWGLCGEPGSRATCGVDPVHGEGVGVDPGEGAEVLETPYFAGNDLLKNRYRCDRHNYL